MNRQQPEQLAILFRDENFIAVHKPPGLLVHKSWISRDTVFLLQTLRDQIGERVYPMHRLDRATSGVIIFGLSGEAAKLMGQLFTDRQVIKTYHAIVRGWLAEPELTVDHPIQDKESNKPLQDAQTHFRELARVELAYAVDRYPSARYSLVEATPLTGRRHQIRKHLKHLSHPIIGDTSYGKSTHNNFFREHFGVHRLLLVARELQFKHPLSGEAVHITSANEPQWTELLRALDLPLS